MFNVTAVLDTIYVGQLLYFKSIFISTIRYNTVKDQRRTYKFKPSRPKKGLHFIIKENQISNSRVMFLRQNVRKQNKQKVNESKSKAQTNSSYLGTAHIKFSRTPSSKIIKCTPLATVVQRISYSTLETIAW